MLGKTNIKVRPNPKINFVEWIESSGTQYIDTGVNTSSYSNVKVQIDMQDTSNNAWESYFGNYGIRLVRDSADTSITNKIKVLFSSDMTYDTIIQDISSRITFSMDKSGFYDANGNKLVSNSRSISDNRNILIFLSYYEGSFDNMGSFKLFNFKIWNDNNIIRDFRPCKDSNGIFCLYEMVEGKFYYNKGTGSFSGGDPI